MDNYWLYLINKYNADGLDFFEVFSHKYVTTITKEEFENGDTIIPKTGYKPYKNINGKKVYIEMSKDEGVKEYEAANAQPRQKIIGWLEANCDDKEKNKSNDTVYRIENTYFIVNYDNVMMADATTLNFHFYSLEEFLKRI